MILQKCISLTLALVASSAVLGCAAASSERRYSIDDDRSLADVFERVQSSVVTLHTVSTGPSLAVGGEVATETGVGSGTLTSDAGEILTAAHVVQTVDEVEVEFFDGTRVAGRVVSSDPVSDLALVQLGAPVPEGFHPAPLGDSDQARVGARVFIVGAPLGVSHTLTVGFLSARRHAPSMVGGELAIEVFQTDAAVNPGNSRGPLFDVRGRVIGVVSYIISQSGSNEGLGFAVTMKTARERVLDRSPIWSGVTFVPLQGRLAEVMNLPPGSVGWLVQRVARDSPGGRLGLRGGDLAAEIEGQPLLLGGDVLLGVLGQPLEDPGNTEALRRRIEELAPEDDLHVVVLRAGERVTLSRRKSEL